MPETDVLPVTTEAPAAPAAPVTPAPTFTGTPPEAAITEAPPMPPEAGQPGIPPPPVAATVVPPPAPPAVAPEVEQYIARLEEQNARAQTQQNEADLRDFVAQRATALESEGLTPEQAQAIAGREGAQLYRSYQVEQANQLRINAAFEIGQRYGVDPRQLMNFPTTAAMAQAAMLATSQSRADAQLKAVQAELAALKKKLAPPQTFATGAVSTQSPSSYIEKLKSGGPLPTAAEIDAYTRRYLTGAV